MARQCFEYGGFQLQALKGQAVAVKYDESGKRTRHRLGVPIRPEASARTALISWVDHLTLVTRGNAAYTVGELWSMFIEDRKADQKPYEDYEYRWRVLEPWFGHLLPSDISDKICRAYAKERFKPAVEKRRMRNGEFQDVSFPNGRAPDTVWTELVILQSCLSWAFAKKHSQTNAMLWRPARSQPRDRVLSREESERLIDCAEGHTKLFVIIATYTGARRGAILELKWSQVDLERGIIDFRSTAAVDPMSKHYKKGRATVHMSPTLRATLKAFSDKARSKYVIEYAGRKVDNIKGAWNKAAERAGLWAKDMDKRERVTPHVLRHTVATWLDDLDVDEKKIQSLLGHAPGTKITRANYIQKRASATKDAVDALESNPKLRVVK